MPYSQNHLPLQAPSALTPAHFGLPAYAGISAPALLLAEAQPCTYYPASSSSSSFRSQPGWNFSQRAFPDVPGWATVHFYVLLSAMEQTTLSPVASLLVCHLLMTVRSREAVSIFPSQLFAHG